MLRHSEPRYEICHKCGLAKVRGKLCQTCARNQRNDDLTTKKGTTNGTTN